MRKVSKFYKDLSFYLFFNVMTLFFFFLLVLIISNFLKRCYI
jgi:hypothetical protein